MLRYIHSMLTAAAIAAVLTTASANAASGRGGASRGGSSGGRGAGAGASRGGSFNGGGMSRGGSFNGGGMSRGGSFNGGGYNRGGYYNGGYNRGSYYNRGYGYPGVGIGIGLGLGLGYAYGGDAYYSGPTYIVAGSPNYAPPASAPYSDASAQEPVIVSQPPPPASSGDAAVIRVRVPANADIWFDGDPTAQKGEVRDFASPPLTAGKEYSYEIRARWMEAARRWTKRGGWSSTPTIESKWISASPRRSSRPRPFRPRSNGGTTDFRQAPGDPARGFAFWRIGVGRDE